MAHELAHHILGHTQDGEKHRDIVENYSSGTMDIREIHANKFAAQLLMPEQAIRFYITRKGVTTALGKIFNVSEAAMQWRLREIGLTH
ncbi:ImmA/IrrE family metallo-endopeptidase [Enterobacter cloacae complex sp. 289A7]|uniref:ImmA/IrrE family metallo-endopeptidase n=1 Tax=Enterobacter cloacae complex sp. 289A7 TaxID=3395850 RepID=UPI003CF131B8